MKNIKETGSPEEVLSNKIKYIKNLTFKLNQAKNCADYIRHFIHETETTLVHEIMDQKAKLVDRMIYFFEFKNKNFLKWQKKYMRSLIVEISAYLITHGYNPEKFEEIHNIFSQGGTYKEKQESELKRVKAETEDLIRQATGISINLSGYELSPQSDLTKFLKELSEAAEEKLGYENYAKQNRLTESVDLHFGHQEPELTNSEARQEILKNLEALHEEKDFSNLLTKEDSALQKSEGKGDEIHDSELYVKALDKRISELEKNIFTRCRLPEISHLSALQDALFLLSDDLIKQETEKRSEQLKDSLELHKQTVTLTRTKAGMKYYLENLREDKNAYNSAGNEAMLLNPSGFELDEKDLDEEA